ncbi:MAG TPA: nucleotidyltransferase family protein [Euzebya sp.]|nr:nucleotidyltransferase family protein [Euzebya sp.]
MSRSTDLAARALQAAAGAPLETVEVPALLATATRERLQGVLWRLVDAGVVEATEEQREAVKVAYRDRVVHTVTLFRLLLAVRRDLDQEGIPFVVLKGPAAAALDHGGSHDRLYNDLDLLVGSRDLDHAVQVLQDAGGVREAPQLRPGYDALFAKNVTLRTPDGLELDLHRNLTPEPFGTFIDQQALFTDLQTFRIGRHTFEALSPLNRFLHACYHAVLGGDDRVVPLLDARMLVTEVGWQEVVERAGSWRAQAVVARAVQAMGDRLDLPADDPLARWAAAYTPTRYEALVLRHTVDQRARQSWRTLLTVPYLDGWRQRGAYLAGLVWPSEAFLAGRGSSRSQWLERGRRTVLSRLGMGR